MTERAVGIAKNMLRKSQDLNLTLLEYRNTPVSGTDKTLVQLLTGLCLRWKLSIAEQLLVPELIDYTEEKQIGEK